MSFQQNLSLLQQQIHRFKTQVPNKEAAKLAFVLPFIECLGFNARDPYEVKPGFSLKIDCAEAQRIDYCLMVNDAPAFLLACENPSLPLDIKHSPLYDCFGAIPCKFAILTNGIDYQFFSDLEEDGVLDSQPFFSIDLETLSSTQVEDLARFQKSEFNPKEILVAVTNLKFRRDLKEALYQELMNPSEEFIFHILKSIKIGRVTQKLIEAYRPDVRECIRETLEELVDDMISPHSTTSLPLTPSSPDSLLTKLSPEMLRNEKMDPLSSPQSPIQNESSSVSLVSDAQEVMLRDDTPLPNGNSNGNGNGNGNGIYTDSGDDPFSIRF
ncbi:MAG: hypothetical protein AAGA10_20085 [Bacteroidota bacterium]